MKCTPDPGGCACCLILNIPCKVTDRVTGETWVRGEAGRMRALIENLEKQTKDLKEQITQLQQKNAQLQDCLHGSYRANHMDHYEVCSSSRLLYNLSVNSITSRTLTPDIITIVYCDCDAFLVYAIL